MNLYFLVEGKRSERRLYPAWLAMLLPDHTRVENVQDAGVNNYYLISGEGYPSILGVHLPRAIEDCANFPAYSHLVLCLDSEETSVRERLNAVAASFAEHGGHQLKHASLKVIVQNRCIETWLLGNRSIVTRAPQGELREFINFYDVAAQCPENMGTPSKEIPHAKFHGQYLRALLRDKHIQYSKTRPGNVAEPHYLAAMLDRVHQYPSHLPTFQAFVDFCKDIRGI